MQEPKKPSRKYLKQRLWKLMMAERCMKRVEALCNEYLELKPSDNDPIGYGLMTAIVVLYAKPFTNTDEVGMLSEKMARYGVEGGNHTHPVLMDTRNRLYAHQNPDTAENQGGCACGGSRRAYRL